MDCLVIRKEPGLMQLGRRLTVAAGASSSDTFVFPKERGKIVGLTAHVLSTTLADLLDISLDYSGNGEEIWQDVGAARYSPQFANADNLISVVSIPEGSESKATVTNDSGNPITVEWVFFFAPNDIKC